MGGDQVVLSVLESKKVKAEIWPHHHINHSLSIVGLVSTAGSTGSNDEEISVNIVDIYPDYFCDKRDNLDDVSVDSNIFKGAWSPPVCDSQAHLGAPVAFSRVHWALWTGIVFPQEGISVYRHLEQCLRVALVLLHQAYNLHELLAVHHSVHPQLLWDLPRRSQLHTQVAQLAPYDRDGRLCRHIRHCLYDPKGLQKLHRIQTGLRWERQKHSPQQQGAAS
ncbi:hypothetical protein OJ253_2515 [Cryptosporidium canis]|uniref:Uncharacterized protein n=1 Tax=Cryptosporidium canis TaxID=195482 RepID=A0A9D5DKC8_9CRYT|nr:hypothetical protein OJ253_2515 [Cryptosporidium canis]